MFITAPASLSPRGRCCFLVSPPVASLSRWDRVIDERPINSSLRGIDPISSLREPNQETQTRPKQFTRLKQTARAWLGVGQMGQNTTWATGNCCSIIRKEGAKYMCIVEFSETQTLIGILSSQLRVTVSDVTVGACPKTHLSEMWLAYIPSKCLQLSDSTNRTFT